MKLLVAGLFLVAACATSSYGVDASLGGKRTRKPTTPAVLAPYECPDSCMRFTDSCNECTCSFNGVSCTKRACKDDFKPEIKCLEQDKCATMLCPEGYSCRFGECYKMCGGIAGIECPEDMACQIEETFPDAAGRCVKAQGASCGGKRAVPVNCPSGYLCVGAGLVFDAPGTCEKLNCGGKENKKCPPNSSCMIAEGDDMGYCKKNEEKTCPKDCKSWFDGCNVCSCQDGVVGGCTKKFCKRLLPSKCMDDENSDSTCKEDLSTLQKHVIEAFMSLFAGLSDSLKQDLLAKLQNIKG